MIKVDIINNQLVPVETLDIPEVNAVTFSPIVPIQSAGIKYNTTEGWNEQVTLIAEKNVIYVYTDYKQDEEGKNIPGFKVGDGLAYLIDMPFADALFEAHMNDTSIHVTREEKEFWNNKVRSIAIDENLLLTNL